MKKLIKLMSVVLALTMVLSALPILVSADKITYPDPPIQPTEPTFDVKEEFTGSIANSTYFKALASASSVESQQSDCTASYTDNMLSFAVSSSRTQVFDIDVRTYGNTLTSKTGVLTYEFKYKMDTASISVCSGYNSAYEGTYNTTLELQPTAAKFNSGYLSGVTAGSDGMTSVTLTYDFNNQTVSATVGGSVAVSRAMDPLEIAAEDANTPFRLVFRAAKTITWSIDDARVTYTPVVDTTEKGGTTDVADFEDKTVGATGSDALESSYMTYTGTATIVNETEYPERGKVLKLHGSGAQSLTLNAGSIAGFPGVSERKGVWSYKFKYIIEGTTVTLRADSSSGQQLAQLNLSSIYYMDNTGAQVKNESKGSGWNEFELRINHTDQTIMTFLNGNLIAGDGKLTYSGSGLVQNILDLRAAVSDMDTIKYFYIDDISVSYDPDPTLPKISAPVYVDSASNEASNATEAVGMSAIKLKFNVDMVENNWADYITITKLGDTDTSVSYTASLSGSVVTLKAAFDAESKYKLTLKSGIKSSAEKEKLMEDEYTFTTWTQELKATTVPKITEDADNNQYVISGTIKNGFGAEKSLRYIVGIYDGSVLKDCYVLNRTVSANSKGNVSATIAKTQWDASVDGITDPTVKVFVWAELTPLSEEVGGLAQ